MTDTNLYKLVIWFIFDALKIFQACTIIQLKPNYNLLYYKIFFYNIINLLGICN